MSSINDSNRITFIAGSMGSGGAERVISILANSYAEEGWKVDVIMLLNDTCYYKIHENIKLIPMCNGNVSRIFYFPRWIWNLRQYFIRNNPNVIISFIARINIITILAAIGLRKRIIISERSNPKKDGRSIWVRFATALLYPLADKIIFQTEAAQSNFSEKIKKKSLIIPNPISVNLRAMENRKEIIVSVGRLRPEKNHRMLINAFHRIRKDFPNYLLFIYGEGPLRDNLVSQIKQLDLLESVFLPGNVINVHEKISCAEIFVLPSQYEGLSNALLEAMMMGLPCISTDYDGASEIIKNGENGLLTPVNDEEEMYYAIRTLIRDKNKANHLGYKAKLSVDSMDVECVIQIWENIIKG